MRLAWADVRVSALRIVPVIVTAALLTSGCHIPGTGASGDGSGGGPITVAVVPGIDNAPLRVAAQNPSAVQAFQKALAQAQSDCAQRGGVQAELSHLTGMSTRDAALVALGTYPTSLDIGQVQRVATLMYDSGMISTPVSVNTLTSG